MPASSTCLPPSTTLPACAFTIIRDMTPPRQPAEAPSLALTVEQAAASLGLSQSHFREHVLPHVRSIKVGRVRIVAVIELERWLYLHGRFADEE